MGGLRDRIVGLESFGSNTNDDRFHIMLLGFDDEGRHLKLAGYTACSKGYFSKSHIIRNKEWFMGEDVVGQALRRREPMRFCIEDHFDRTKPKPDTSLVCEKSQEKDLKVELAFPMRYPPNDRGAIFGVIAFASCSYRCGLHGLANETGMEEIRKLSYEHFAEEITRLIDFPQFTIVM
jgi:hypothetical protein